MEKETKQPSATPEKVWATLDRVSEMHEKFDQRMEKMRQEADRRQQELDRRFKELRQDIEATNKQMKETDRQIKETGRQMQETDRQIKETGRQMQETDRRLRKVGGEFDHKWGRLMECLVEGDLEGLLRGWGLDVPKTGRRIKGRLNGEYAEVDIVATGDDAVVVVEVKTTLRAKDVKYFVEKLGKLVLYEKDWYGKKIYGAVAYLDVHEAAQVHAERQGLLVIRATGSSASIVNDTDSFRLKEYRSGKFMSD